MPRDLKLKKFLDFSIFESQITILGGITDSMGWKLQGKVIAV